MDRRTILALLLIMLILMGFGELTKILYPPPPPVEGTETSTPASAEGGTVTPDAERTAPDASASRAESGEVAEPGPVSVEEPGSPVDAEAVPTPYPRTERREEETITLDSDTLRVVLTSRGASVSHLALKRHLQHASGDLSNPDDWLVLLSEFQKGARTLQIIDRAKGSPDLAGVVWEPLPIPAAERGLRAAFRYATGSGLVFEKEFSLPETGHDISVKLVLRNENPALTGTVRDMVVMGPSGLYKEGLPTSADEPIGDGVSVMMIGRTGGQMGLLATGAHDAALKVELVAEKEMVAAGGSVTRRPERPLQWIGVNDFYFAAVLDGGEVAKSAVFDVLSDRVTDAAPPAVPDQNTVPRTRVRSGLVVEPEVPGVGGDPKVVELTLFAGPKSRKILGEKENVRYRGLLSAGRSYCIFPDYIMDPIVSLFIRSVLLFQGWFGSFGFSIILLTLIVKTILFPVTLKQQVSMGKYQRAMARVKPELDKLRERYKGNPKKMQKEQIELFKKHGMSPLPPLGGCLPMLITMPVFIGMFYTFGMAVELRHTSFLWISDLTQPDHAFRNTVYPFSFACLDFSWINILPILMSVTWVMQGKMQQKATPVAADPAMAQQQKMMVYMPAMFGLMLYNYAAGVHLYQFTSSLLGIFEQKFLRKRFLPAPEPVPAPRKGKGRG